MRRFVSAWKSIHKRYCHPQLRNIRDNFINGVKIKGSQVCTAGGLLLLYKRAGYFAWMQREAGKLYGFVHD